MGTNAKLLGLAATAFVAHAALALAFSSETFFYFNVGTSQKLFKGSVNAYAVFDDVDRHYFPYATRAILGKVPYRDFPVEYPVLSLPLFLLPRLVAEDELSYRYAFGAEMLLADAALVYLVGRRVARREGWPRVPGRIGWYTLCVAAFGSLTVARYDLAPTLVAFAATLLWSSGRNAPGGVLAGVGALVKVFPGVIAGPFAVRELGRWRSSFGRGTLAFALTLALGVAGWYALAGDRFGRSLGYHLDRGLEIESVYSGVLGVVAGVAGAPLKVEYSHASAEITTPWTARVASLAFPTMVAAMVLVAWRSRRAGPDDGPRWAGAAVIAFVVTGKVLSPQYMIWILPFVAVLEGRPGRRARAIFLAACVLTTAVYPWCYIGLVNFIPLAMAILNLRNGLLVGLLALLLLGREPGKVAPS